MKVRFAVIAAVLCLLLSACGGQKPAPATEPETAATEAMVTVRETTEATQPETVSALPVVITKNPTGEKLSPGGKTWFVAHADNASFVTWEFVSPEGKIYSVADTMGLHPGLLLDISQQDTVALEKVPLSLNGWSAQARFDGPGGTATTEPAMITVSKSEGAYDAVIERYRGAVAAKANGYEAVAQHDVSEMLLYASHVGYVLQDLDGNGVQELIIAGIGYDIPEEPVIFELFTLENNVPVSIARSWARNRLFLMQDGKILNEGSSGAAHSNFSVMQVAGSTLRFLDGLYTTDTNADGSPSEYTFYYTTSNQFGDAELMAADNGMEEKVAMTFLNRWRASITLPELCLIG